ncbi:MAG: hypothetical protein AABY49_04070 [Planctomycetota bacterium]|mgnify:CR=1 FL=1
MSKLLSLKIRDDIFLEVEKITKKKKIPGNAYINKALAFYNDLNKRGNLKEQLRHESNMVKNNSLEILDEFEKLEDENKEISYTTPELLRRHIDSRGCQTRRQSHKTILKKTMRLFQFN